MKFSLILLSFISLNAFAMTSKFECKFLDYYLMLDASINNHIVHELKINGQISVAELHNNRWFIEKVNCKRAGFEIVASHAQYNDSTKKVFMLKYNTESGYQLSNNGVAVNKKH